MSFKNNFLLLLFVCVFAKEVSTWTIDLPEVRRHIFEKAAVKHTNMNKHEPNNPYEAYITPTETDRKFYSNAEGNSLFNSDRHHDDGHHDNGYHDDEYGHQQYMEKKVHEIVREGSAYLEGLRKSLVSYNQFLKYCSGRNESRPTPSSIPNYPMPSSSNMTSQNLSSIQDSLSSMNLTSLAPPLTNLPGLPTNTTNSFENQALTNQTSLSGGSNDGIKTGRDEESSSEGDREYVKSERVCGEAMKAREHVRRYADLALWATKRLQDLAYARKYQKVDEREENELVLRLAWFLERLAYLTGYEPDPKRHLDERVSTRSPTTSPTPSTMVPSTMEQNQRYADCLKQHSAVPATERCAYVGPLSTQMQEFIDRASGKSSSPTNTGQTSLQGNTEENLQPQPSDILETSDNTLQILPLPSQPILKSRTKRSAEHELQYAPDFKAKLSNPHLIAEFIKKNIHKLKTVVKTVKSLKETTYKALLEDKEHIHHEKERHHGHEFAYGSIPYLTIHKRSIDENNDGSTNQIPLTKTEKLQPKIPVISEEIVSINKKPVLKLFEQAMIDITESPYNHLPISEVVITNNKSLKKRSLTAFNYLNLPKTIKNEKLIKKRAADDPLTKVAKFYFKHKIWDQSNPEQPTNLQLRNDFENFDVENQITDAIDRNKRSLFNKKTIHIQYNVPKSLQTPKPIIHHESDHRAKILAHLHKIHSIAQKKFEKAHHITTKKLETLSNEKHHHKVSKRSVHYGHMYLPRVSEDPEQDISYLVKNRRGTHYNRNLVQAAEVSAGVQQVYQTGDILVVQRYGSNYNPLIPDAFLFGVAKTLADI